MIKTCIIDNYNYSNFIEEAIDSALSQTIPFDEIIIVDDGSTDNSKEVIERYLENDKVRAVFKFNGGQMSAFNEGFKKSKGDIVCFLDADDYYESNFLESVMEVFNKNESIDHVFTDHIIVDKNSKSVRKQYRRKKEGDIDYGYTAAMTYNVTSWTGSPTSMNAFKRSLLERFLPFEMEKEFIISADRPLVMGVSLVGGRKFYLRKCLVNYRHHGNNLYTGRSEIRSELYVYEKSILDRQMFRKMLSKVELQPDDLIRHIDLEYSSKPNKTFEETRLYIYAVLLSRTSFVFKLKSLFKIKRAYIKYVILEFF